MFTTSLDVGAVRCVKHGFYKTIIARHCAQLLSSSLSRNVSAQELRQGCHRGRRFQGFDDHVRSAVTERVDIHVGQRQLHCHSLMGSVICTCEYTYLYTPPSNRQCWQYETITPLLHGNLWSPAKPLIHRSRYPAYCSGY